jgi:hypothetical protein
MKSHKTTASVHTLIPVKSILRCVDITCHSQTKTQAAPLQITATILPAQTNTVSERHTKLLHFAPADHNKQAIQIAHDVHGPRLVSPRLQPSHSAPQTTLPRKQARLVHDYATASGRKCTENLHHMRRLREVVEGERDCVVPEYRNGSNEPCALRGSGRSIRTEKDKSIGSAEVWTANGR